MPGMVNEVGTSLKLPPPPVPVSHGLSLARWRPSSYNLSTQLSRESPAIGQNQPLTPNPLSTAVIEHWGVKQCPWHWPKLPQVAFVLGISSKEEQCGALYISHALLEEGEHGRLHRSSWKLSSIPEMSIYIPEWKPLHSSISFYRDRRENYGSELTYPKVIAGLAQGGEH